jgi:hypothetical protein
MMKEPITWQQEFDCYDTRCTVLLYSQRCTVYLDGTFPVYVGTIAGLERTMPRLLVMMQDSGFIKPL